MNRLPTLCLLLGGLTLHLHAAELPPLDYRRDPAQFMDAEGAIRPIAGLNDWTRRRADTLERIQLAAGPLPDTAQFPAPEVEIVFDDMLECGVRRQMIAYYTDSTASPRVRAWLLSPTPESALFPEPFEPRARAAVLCLHQTNRTLGKHEPAGVGGNPDLFYALELARRGFVTLAPDFSGSGEHPGWGTYESGYVSGTMKGIADHIRAVDLLSALPGVDPERIGVIGHSLGGFNALMVAVFEPRLKAVVTSCGYVNWQAYADREGSIYLMAGANYMPRLARRFGSDPKQAPFDWHEVIAALAPRPVFVNAPLRDDPFLVEGVHETLEAARPIYALYGEEDAVEAVHPDTGHSFPSDVREQAYRFVERHLARDPESLRDLCVEALTEAVRRVLEKPFAGAAEDARAAVESALAERLELVRRPETATEILVAAHQALVDQVARYERARLPYFRFPVDGWRFQVDPEDAGREAGWYAVDFDDSEWRKDVPIERGWQAFMETPYIGVAWYRRTFDVPDLPLDALSVWLTFRGVDEEGWIWINGEPAGEQAIGPSGFAKPFQFEVTDRLKPGQTNQITVRVRNSIGDGGIWQPVVMTVRDR